MSYCRYYRPKPSEAPLVRPSMPSTASMPCSPTETHTLLRSLRSVSSAMLFSKWQMNSFLQNSSNHTNKNKKLSRTCVFFSSVQPLHKGLDTTNMEQLITPLTTLGHLAQLAPEQFAAPLKSLVANFIVKDLLMNDRVHSSDMERQGFY